MHSRWLGMIDRCHNTKNQNYRHYGERGIIVCYDWRISFERFVEDMGLCPSDSYSLDRINVNGDYEPLNCRWATAKQQANNKRNSIKYTSLNKLLAARKAINRTDKELSAIDSMIEQENERLRQDAIDHLYLKKKLPSLKI